MDGVLSDQYIGDFLPRSARRARPAALHLRGSASSPENTRTASVVLVSRRKWLPCVKPGERTRIARSRRLQSMPHPEWSLHATADGDRIASSHGSPRKAGISSFCDFLGLLPVYKVPLRPTNLVGIDALRAIAGAASDLIMAANVPALAVPNFESVGSFLSDLEKGRSRHHHDDGQGRS